MTAVINFLSSVFSIVMVTVGVNNVTLGQTIAGTLIIWLALSVFKRIKI